MLFFLPPSQLENFIQENVRSGMEELKRTAVHTQTAAMLEMGTNLLSQSAEQTRKLTDVETQVNLLCWRSTSITAKALHDIKSGARIIAIQAFDWHTYLTIRVDTQVRGTLWICFQWLQPNFHWNDVYMIVLHNIPCLSRPGVGIKPDESPGDPASGVLPFCQSPGEAYPPADSRDLTPQWQKQVRNICRVWSMIPPRALQQCPSSWNKDF